MQVCVGGMPAKLDVSTAGVAIAAVDAQPTGVMLMAERHRLLALDPLIGGIWRTDHAADHPQHERDDEDSAEDRDASKSIGYYGGKSEPSTGCYLGGCARCKNGGDHIENSQ